MTAPARRAAVERAKARRWRAVVARFRRWQWADQQLGEAWGRLSMRQANGDRLWAAKVARWHRWAIIRREHVDGMVAAAMGEAWHRQQLRRPVSAMMARRTASAVARFRRLAWRSKMAGDDLAPWLVRQARDDPRWARGVARKHLWLLLRIRVDAAVGDALATAYGDPGPAGAETMAWAQQCIERSAANHAAEQAAARRPGLRAQGLGGPGDPAPGVTIRTRPRPQ